MDSIIDAAIKYSRTVLSLLLLIFIAGMAAYNAIPKEREPDVQIPIIYVSMYLEGISPEDAERLLIRPVEKKLRSIEGIKEITAFGAEGSASVTMEFNAGFDSDKALLDVREKMDEVRPELPDDMDEPTVHEVNLSLFPVVNVILTANISERALVAIARDLRDKVEEIPNVLSVDIAGDREDIIEIITDPLAIEGYALSAQAVFNMFARNNLLVAAGALDTDSGRFAVKTPGLLEGIKDFGTIPLKTENDAVVSAGDIAELRRSFRDPTGYARVNGAPAVVLEVSKRTGSNIIETIDEVRKVVAREQQYWPDAVQVIYSQDKSQRILDMLSDLENNIILALILVVATIVLVVGVRSASLVAISIPAAFLMGILLLSAIGATMNIVVLFSLILSVGMLVDTAIVVCEFADRKLIDGVSHRQAYAMAAKRMAWPLVASTITTLIVFFPLLSWPGTVGQFMKFMPITLIAILSSSLIVALIFLPAIGTLLGKTGVIDENAKRRIHAAESGDLRDLDGIYMRYAKLLHAILLHPRKFAGGMFSILLMVYVLYGFLGAGVEFFPNIEPDNARILVHARGNLSTDEKDAVLKKVEERIYSLKDDVRVFYARSGGVTGAGRQNAGEDVIGVIQLEFHEWKYRRPAEEVLNDVIALSKDIPGVIVEAQKEKGGPSQGKPVEIAVSSRFPALLEPAIEKVQAVMAEVGGLKDIENNLPIPAIEWNLSVDREQAAKFGADILAVGNYIRMVTNGLKATTYRPDDTDEEVDVLIRFPEENRNIRQLDMLKVVTESGVVIPISNFVTREARPQVNTINRLDGMRTYTIKADVQEGVVVDNKVQLITEKLKAADIDPRVKITFKGETEDQKETGTFLRNAFMLALFAMALVLVTQFNSFYYMVIIMSAIFLSTVGVLLGLMITQQPFGIVMCGVGIIALAGVVVNNNIIFIDTYRILREEMGTAEALIRTGVQRLRPILLTAGTTILGLLPMVIGMNLNFIEREITFGAPSSQWWKQLSTTIAGGLAFATVLTLFLTPTLLLLGDKYSIRKKKKSPLQENPANA